MSVKLSRIAPEIREAFKAGNMARKKEAVQDTVTSIKDDVAKFKYYTGYDDDAIEVNKNGIFIKGHLIINGNTRLYAHPEEMESLPSNLTIDGMLSIFIDVCPKLCSIPLDMKFTDDACTRSFSGINLYIPPDTNDQVEKFRQFFRGHKIPFIDDPEMGFMTVKATDWVNWQKEHGYINEAFRAGNKARRKESAADTVESVPMDLKAAVYSWCNGVKQALKKRNANTHIPYKADDFYLPEAVWSDLESEDRFESEENIHLTGRGKNARLKGSVAIDIARIDDGTVELGCWYERADGKKSEWLYFDDDEQNETVTYIITISAADLGSERGVCIMTDALDRCWNMMFG